MKVKFFIKSAIRKAAVSNFPLARFISYLRAASVFIIFIVKKTMFFKANYQTAVLELSLLF